MCPKSLAALSACIQASFSFWRWSRLRSNTPRHRFMWFCTAASFLLLQFILFVTCSYKYSGPATVFLASCRWLLKLKRNTFSKGPFFFLQSPESSSKELKAGEFGSQVLACVLVLKKTWSLWFLQPQQCCLAHWTANQRPLLLILCALDLRAPHC